MIYIAHRGAPSLRAENTVPSFQTAAAAGMTWYELDVHLTADSQLVVHHDYSFLRSAGVNREIGELTLAQIRKLDVRRLCPAETEPCRVPLLKEVFAVIPPNANVNIEIKNDNGRYRGIERAVARFAAVNGFKRIMVSNFNHRSLLELREMEPVLRLGVLTDGGRQLEKALAIALELRAQSVNVGLKTLSAEAVAQAHDAGLKVFVWTIKDRAQLEFAASCGADGVFINDPRLKL